MLQEWGRDSDAAREMVDFHQGAAGPWAERKAALIETVAARFDLGSVAAAPGVALARWLAPQQHALIDLLR